MKSILRNAVALAATAAVAALAGCGAPPTEEAPTGSTNEAWTQTCTAPFTSYQWIYTGHGVYRGCAPDTQTPGLPPGSWPSITPSPINAPPTLAGCTVGLSIPGLIDYNVTYTANIWACPSTVTPPSSIGPQPACQFPSYGHVTTAPCEWGVTSGVAPNANPFVGDADDGFILVEQDVLTAISTSGDSGGGCRGGCLFPNP
jgi:hypothetical protein